MRSEGNTLYSYAEPIAKKFEGNVAWVTTRKWSQTTSHHTRAAASALEGAGWNVIESPDPEFCLNCKRIPSEHVNGKCLFTTGTYVGSGYAA